jgi:hypothetical protein
MLTIPPISTNEQSSLTPTDWTHKEGDHDMFIISILLKAALKVNKKSLKIPKG